MMTLQDKMLEYNTIAGTLDELESKFSNRTKDYFSPRLAQD